MIEAVPEATPRNRRYVNEFDQIDPSAHSLVHGVSRRGAGSCEPADLHSGRTQTCSGSARVTDAAASESGCASEPIPPGQHRGGGSSDRGSGADEGIVRDLSRSCAACSRAISIPCVGRSMTPSAASKTPRSRSRPGCEERAAAGPRHPSARYPATPKGPKLPEGAKFIGCVNGKALYRDGKQGFSFTWTGAEAEVFGCDAR